MAATDYPRPRKLRWLLLAGLLGAPLSFSTDCSDEIRNAFLLGAHSTADALLNALFDNLASDDDFTPVTVKAVHTR